MVTTDPRVALWRVRQVIGVQRYLRDTRTTFGNQVRQIRAAIVAIDNGLPAHPRVVDTRTFRPWASMDLGSHFDTYMDTVWRGAQLELSSFIEDIYDSIRPLCTQQKRQQYQRSANQDMVTLCNDWTTMGAQRRALGTVQRPW